MRYYEPEPLARALHFVWATLNGCDGIMDTRHQFCPLAFYSLTFIVSPLPALSPR